ncbi:cytochrome o ubiquinol oxidase subunit III [Acinetobacter gerneri]|jgi:cytochrome o ubiquinol oxidase subunit 3|uniref:Cytochrome bo(3) ubiquinol oxidase subunit 3 n=2 Tax=Acinetobacter gerneri TaxID=202952 RepID=N8ZKJ3_9GAMM|nr:cytochrome o ubiquinol oxidase subunit III [Acinetobacter gerneri]ENV34269.1 cytochrome o ubiquinol oxidase, subunit III [Acinetobacter gerneri DSM 14967 = CIP 107464 = MTCC 9824]EPR84999.1 Cytochrome O ubiquinol oxidase subunit III [Acinetobacter gerneri DSM 14967 = CIP 107464 = MTCC 9824]MCH4246174.1 cytochrome o ubiquinol oxidase subunit III [Acinetobacter gerneri]MDQ9011100.1 cytochrome o ubiquinol oxidase subunit III [Acinetobacter gerneri]MDQ9015208.1 cytochrome o ubiquinol oxidase su
MAEVLHHENHGHDEHHHDDTDITVFGFWTYLMSDLILFGTLFIAFAVLSSHVPAGTPDAKELFGHTLDYVLIETFALLISSVTFGFAVLASYKKNVNQVITWLIVTFIFGATFIGMEVNEFHHLVAEGHGPSTSAFLSSFFTLVGTHGIHVTSGLVWMIVLMVQIKKYGLTTANTRRLACLSLFWHFLDIVWICVFSVVYLLGVL